MMFTELVISTSVLIGVSNCEFDIDSIYNYMVMTDTVIKLKCNNKEKTKNGEVQCKTFYNQISICLKNGSNVKLFGNGKFQISGVKTISHGTTIINFIFGLIGDMKGSSKIKPQEHKGFMTYNSKILVKKSGGYKCSHIIKDDKIIINGNKCSQFDQNNMLYITQNHVNKTKKLYNSNCDEIGNVEYIMTRKNKNLCIKGCVYTKKDDENYTIINKYNNEIGVMKIHLDGKINIHDSSLYSEIVIEYNSCSISPVLVDINFANINSNTKYVMQKGVFLNRDLICSHLKDKKIKYVYDPCRYSGVKFTILDTKITIFRTGSILFSSRSNSEECYRYIVNMFNENVFTANNDEVDQSTKIFSIWDI
jgi:hypothetical protein